MDCLKPSDAEQAAEMIGWAAAEKKSLEIYAGGSKRRLGRSTRADLPFDASGLTGVIDYDPAELILCARPATPMAEIETLLAQQGQMLAFEPPDWRGLLGGGGEPTLGGVLACNLAGPRRARAGAARDFFLGFSAVNGRGEIYKAGGKVVKNVTGFDMCKLIAGSYGTLSLLTETTLKVAPRPEAACTLLLSGLADAIAIPLLAQALNTPHEVSGAAHLPAPIARRSCVAAAASTESATALRLEGPAPSIAFRADALEQLLGRGLRLGAEETALFWREIGEARQLLPNGERCVWRLCPTPSAAPAVVARIRARFASAEAIYDWGGGLIWLSLDVAEAEPDGGAAFLRGVIRQAGGHALLAVAAEGLRTKVDVFEPEEGALADLSRRVKANFDPFGVLNPGRMRAGY